MPTEASTNSGAIPADEQDLPSIGLVILTRGNRPAELQRAITSAQSQRGVSVDIVVVGNGWQPEGLPAGIKTVHLPTNVGVGGRNAGVPQVLGEVLFFLDDDAWLPDDRALARVSEIFATHPRVGMVQTRIVDPDANEAPRYWVPRLRKGDPARPSTAMYVLEAAVAIRREVFERAGGWAADFRYAHEGIEMAWRVWDAGYVVWYAGDLATCHPAIFPTRHAEYQLFNGRNRVWLVRRNLPWLVGVPYLASWSAVDLLRTREDAEQRQAWLRGFRQGWQDDPGQRRPLRWRTVWEMARHGRPPLV